MVCPGIHKVRVEPATRSVVATCGGWKVFFHLSRMFESLLSVWKLPQVLQSLLTAWYTWNMHMYSKSEILISLHEYDHS